MPRRDCHGRANLTTLGVLTILVLSGVGGFAFGKFFFSSRLKVGASEVRVPDSLTKLQPEASAPVTGSEPQTCIRPVTGYSLSPGDEGAPTPPRVDPLAPLDVSPPAEVPPGTEQPPDTTGGILETPLPPGTIFIVLIGSFLDENNAVYWRDDLNNRGYRADIEKTQSSGQTFFRVVVGRFKERPAADRVADKLRNEGYTVIVVPQTPAAPAPDAKPAGAPGAPA